MTKKITTISLLVIGIILISFYVISSTYSVIINVLDKDGQTEILNDISIRDLLIDENGMYNSTYYDVINELDITEEEAEMLMDSIPLNRALDEIVASIVDYNFHNKSKLSNDELYNLIVDGINEDSNITNNLRLKLIAKTKEYINDISDYMYDIKTVNQGEKAWYILLLG